MKVIIERKRWSRGKQTKNALLVGRKTINESPRPAPEPVPRHNTMCCLGFMCLALGVKPSELRDKGMPSDVAIERDSMEGLEGLVQISTADESYVDTDFATDAAGVNDDGSITEPAREKRLKEIARENGHQFVFEG